MKARLMALGIPAMLVGTLFAGAFTWKTMGMRGDVWYWVWPSLVALAFLAFAIGAFLARMQRAGWPLLVGFLAQLVGILLLVTRTLTKPVAALWWTLWIFGAAVLVVFLLWIVTYLRARALERKILKGVAVEGADPQKIQQIQKDMMATLALLRKAGAGRNAIFELPWFLFIGRSQAGKTVAIKNSGLGLPVKKDRLKGSAGTHSVDWFFTSDVIFVDTPGAWTTEGADDEAREYWKTLLRMLRKYRGRRPLDGLLVVVPADDLLSKDGREIQEQAGHAREVIDLLHGELRFRFPVYVLVTKCDLVDGFVDYFRSFPAQRWHEIVGWSNPDPNHGDPAQLVPKGFRRVLRRLRGYRLELLARIAKGRVARRLFFFPENFKRLEEPLALFVDVLFSEDPEHETPVFRGFYFTSGTQGEGSPLGDAIAEIARGLSLRLPGAGLPGQDAEEPKRGYFLKELFRHLMVGDEGLVSRTAGHWWKRRRDTLFASFLPASLAGGFVLLALVSYGLNRGVYANVRERVPIIAREIRALDPAPTGPKLMEALRGKRDAGQGGIEEIRAYHEAMTGFSVFKRFGMRRPGALANETFRVFREHFESAVLVPTLLGAKEAALDPDSSCNDRVDAYYAAVWLRAGRVAQGEKDLQAFERVWGVGADADEASELFLDQFNYLLDHHDGKSALLPGFPLDDLAARIRADCSRKGSESLLDSYLKFQQECRDQSGKETLDRCFGDLERALNTRGEDGKLRDQIATLKTDLRTFADNDREPGAEAAYNEFEKFEIPVGKTNECLESFNRDVAAMIKDLVKEQDDLIDDCKAEVKTAASARRPAAREAIQKQEKEMKDKARNTVAKMNEWSAQCPEALTSINRLEADTLFSFLADYRKCRCLGDLCGVAVAEAPRPRATSPPASGPKPKSARGTTYLWAPAIPVAYTKQAWNAKRPDWDDPGASEAEGSAIRQNVRTYADRYVQEWKSYLARVKLKEHGEVPEWLEQLANTPELGEVLRPAGEALAREAPTGNPDLDSFGLRLAELNSVYEFAFDKLTAYQNHLRKIAGDLKKCREDAAFSSRYRQTLNSSDNQLFQAKEWVEANAGIGLASGALKETLLAPLQAAEDYVQSSTTLKESRWEDLREAHAKVKDQFPIDENGTELIGVSDLTVLFGGAQGLVPGLHDPASLAVLGPGPRDWLGRAQALTSIFFADKQDDLKPLKLLVSVEPPKFIPTELADDFVVKEVRIEWGGGVDQYKWSNEDEQSKEPKRVTLPLFGDDASTSCRLTVTPAKPGRTMLGKKKEDEMEPCKLSVPSGPWAPLKLLVKGLPEGGARGGTDLTLTYELPFPYSKKKEGKIVVDLHVSAPGIGRLLQLTQNGLDEPPQRSGQ